MRELKKPKAWTVTLLGLLTKSLRNQGGRQSWILHRMAAWLATPLTTATHHDQQNTEVAIYVVMYTLEQSKINV